MIKAKHTQFHTAFFTKYSWWLIKRHFASVQFFNDAVAEPNKSIVLIGNHFSWWDGFLALHLDLKFWRKKFYVMMLEKQLRQNIFLSKAGAFSICKKERSMIDSLNYAAQIIENPNNLLTLFPQGQIESLYTETFDFEQGWTRIFRTNPNTQLIMYAALVDFKANKKPHLYFFTQNAEISADVSDISQQFQKFYRASKQKMLKLNVA